MEKDIGNIEMAKKLLSDEKESRLLRCKAEIDRVLKEHDCELVTIPFITNDGRVAAEVKLVVIERKTG